MIATAALLFSALATRIGTIEAEVGQDQTGAWRCSLSASSGDAEVDASLCRAAIECTQAHGNDREALGWCMDERRAAIIAELPGGGAA